MREFGGMDDHERLYYARRRAHLLNLISKNRDDGIALSASLESSRSELTKYMTHHMD